MNTSILSAGWKVRVALCVAAAITATSSVAWDTSYQVGTYGQRENLGDPAHPYTYDLTVGSNYVTSAAKSVGGSYEEISSSAQLSCSPELVFRARAK